MLTYDIIYQHDPCWLRDEGGDDRLRAVCERLGGSFTIGDVLRAEWISAADRIWVATRPGVLSDRTLRLFADRCVRRRPGIGLDIAPWATGKARLDALWAAQCAASAAWDASVASSVDAAWQERETERQRQVADLLELMADEADEAND